MKNLFFLLLFFASIANSQIVNIPDANFKAELIYRGVDTNHDGEIQTAEALNVGSLVINYLNSAAPYIYDATGIEAFTNLSYLSIKYCYFTTLDLTQLTNLMSLECKNNVNLTTLNISGLSNLQILDCSNNALTSLDLSTINAATVIWCGSNNISSISMPLSDTLTTFACNSNSLTSLDTNNLTNLTNLNCSYNQLTSLAIDDLVNLQDLNCNNNQINSLNFSNITNLTNVACNYNALTELTIANSPNLNHVFCQNNSITSITLPIINNIEILHCHYNLISNLDLTHFQSINNLICSHNLIQNLDFSNNLVLNWLDLGFNPYTSINLSPLTNLKYLFFGSNTDSVPIDFSPLINLDHLNIEGTQFDTINLNNCTHLKALTLNVTNLSSFDISNCQELQYISLYGNPNITSCDLSNFPAMISYTFTGSALNNINIKNGGTLNYINFSSCQNLHYICCDTDDIQNVYYALSSGGFNYNSNINSYCSFIPGGNYNTITGNLTFDADNNGCDSNDLTQPNIRVNINDGITDGATFSNTAGNYSFFTQTGDFTLTPAIENAAWFTFTPATATIPFVDNNQNTATQNFCLAPNGVHSDVEMVIQPLTPARPGFEATYKLVYKNKGNQMSTVYLNLNYDASVLDFVSSTSIPTLTTDGHISWTVLNLQPFQSGSVIVVMHVNAPTDTPPVNIGNLLTFNSFIDVSTDEHWEDNAFTLQQTVVGSYDPNEITCLEGDLVSTTEIGKYLHYGITFENTGNYPAENVVVKDVIDTNQYDINSLQLLNTSYPVYTKITGNVVEFIFQNINLAAVGGNPPVGGHGDVLFKIKSKNSLTAGDFVNKSAKIYFDYNAPITTNDAQTTFSTLNTSVHQFDNSVRIYPNPSKGIVTITCTSNLKTVALFDMQGRLLETDLIGQGTATIDLGAHQNGIYFIKITTDKGSKVEKIVKE